MAHARKARPSVALAKSSAGRRRTLTGRPRPAHAGGVTLAVPFVGRSVELSRLIGVLGGTTDDRTVLVIGDAGIGKTRLLAEAVAHGKGAGEQVLRGSCLPLTEALPLLPVVEALRSYAHRDSGHDVQEILNGQPRYVRAELVRLLPECDIRPETSQEMDDGDGEGWWRERLFAAVREFLAAAAARSPVSLVIEDLHWADRSTLDLLRFLISGGRLVPLPMALSCRGDEPLSDSAFPEWLAAARTAPGVAEIALEPFTADDAALQATALLGRAPDGPTLAALYRRTGGNPFFTEQLIAAGLGEEGRTTMATPPGLTALLAARVRRASKPAQQVLAALAVAGRPIDELTLATVSELDLIVVEDALIELLEARLVTTQRDDAYLPRHQLLGDVVSAGLLAARRRAMHARFALSLAARSGADSAAEIAAHWSAAGDTDQELAWSATAGKAAEGMYAYAEAARHWERVIQLWDAASTTPPGLRLGMAYLHALGDLYYSSDRRRGSELTEEGLARVGEGADEADRYERAVLLSYAATFRRVDSLAAALRASEESVRLFSTLPPSHERASSLGSHGKLLDVARRPDDALRAMSEGLADARARGSRDDQAAALTDLTHHELIDGDWQRGLAYLAEAEELVRGSRDVESRLMVAIYRTHVLLRTGQLLAAVDAGENALQAVDSQGGGSFPEASNVRANVAEALLELGRVTDAATIIDPLVSDEPTQLDRVVHEVRIQLDVVRGDLDAATTRLASLWAVVPDNPSIVLELEQQALEIAVWRQNAVTAVEPVMTILGRMRDHPDGRETGRLLSMGMRACADQAERARARADDQGVRAALTHTEQLQARQADLRHNPFADHPAVVTAGAELATWQAELARAAATDQADLWGQAARLWELLQRPHRTSYALWRLAYALLAAGERGHAAPVLQEASALAATMVPLREVIAALGRRARIDLRHADQQDAGDDELDQDPYDLTPREREVLRLVVQGLTNAQIGTTLFMSPKTASVHVTHILQKLGVSGRVQAAALAERAGLLEIRDGD
jgi:DNA-binding CsgD family transcriptional regulator